MKLVRWMMIEVNNRYMSSSNISIYFDISTDFLIARKNDGTFRLGIHYVQPSKKMLRWNIEELEKWFKIDSNINNTQKKVKMRVNIGRILK